ncbi:hypothetical protein LTR85_003721 [Meristemomyces frigidus]|nr:hypothetical protein LTR85_003721 [Meristemomyces frigidus]
MSATTQTQAQGASADMSMEQLMQSLSICSSVATQPTTVTPRNMATETSLPHPSHGTLPSWQQFVEWIGHAERATHDGSGHKEREEIAYEPYLSQPHLHKNIDRQGNVCLGATNVGHFCSPEITFFEAEIAFHPLAEVLEAIWTHQEVATNVLAHPASSWVLHYAASALFDIQHGERRTPLCAFAPQMELSMQNHYPASQQANNLPEGCRLFAADVVTCVVDVIFIHRQLSVSRQTGGIQWDAIDIYRQQRHAMKT